MKEYLSFGAGVDSTALMLLLLDEDRKFEALFVDHETDWPETYEYVDYLIGEGYDITRLKPDCQGYSSLFDFCWDKRILPSIIGKWCNDKFKIRPQNKYRKTPCRVYLGYNFSERQRAKHGKSRKGETQSYPLIEKRITSERCTQIIKEHGLRIPPKSGCYFCPLQPLSEWKRLMVDHPELYIKAMELESRAKNKKMTLMPDGSKLSAFWQENKLTNYI